MRFRAGNRGRARYSQSGSILPMVAFGLLFIFAYMAFCADLMREILAVQQTRFASRAAALHALPYASLDASGQLQNSAVRTPDGEFTAEALASMQAALSQADGTSTGEPWNSAGSGEGGSGSAWLSPVLFDAADIKSANNTADKSDPILQLTINRSGADALSYFFLPVRYAADLMNGGSVPADATSTEINQTIEVYTQPALRIGAAAPVNSSTGKAQAIANGRLACFPLAINYDDFKRLVLQQAGGACSLHIADPQAGQVQTNTDLRAYFVNLKSGGSISNYYCDAQSPSSLNNLIGLLEYFSPSSSGPQALELPGSVERSVNLDRFQLSAFANNSELGEVLSSLPTRRAYIFPVVKDAQASQCEVVGFALLRLEGVAAESNSWTFNCMLGESLPVLNASCSPAYKTVPGFDGSKISALSDGSTGPFAARNYDSASSSFSARTPGVVMAPILSPRKKDRI